MELIVSLSKYLFLLVVLIVFGNCYIDFGSHAHFIPNDEVQTLRIIFSKLMIGWDVSRTTCSNGGQSLNFFDSGISTNVMCDCSFNNGTICHVTNIQLKGLKLNGVLPAEFGNLSHLQVMDLSSNNFSGSIPETFSNLKNLTDLLLYENQLGGALPDSLGSLSSLQTMVLSSNYFSGSISETFSNLKNLAYLSLRENQLGGALPNSLGNLSSLQIMVLSSNYFSGSIPETFSNLKNLAYLSLRENQLGGALPDSLGNLSSLQTMILSSNDFSGGIPETFSNLKNLAYLSLRENQLGGALPDSLGNLSSLQTMTLSSNNFNGSIPETFGNLKNLIDFWIDGNRLSGKIPAFIGNWINIETVHMQGTNMEGPIPSNISLLTNLTDLMISDLNGTSMAFPNLQDLKQLRVLVLRNCLLTSSIPEYIGNMKDMQILDFSFNRLTGEIPDTIGKLQSLKYMFLTNNSLNGSIPSWLVNSKENFDVSYNNFTGSTTVNCQQSNVSLVSSFPLTTSNANSWCWMKDLPCPIKPEYHSLFINCGGEEMSYDGNNYEEDLNPLGPSYFAFSDSIKWAYSSTGVFSQNDNANFIASNTYNLNVTGIYKTARLSPLLLRYYGLCLRKGSYRVQLHFAEIMYSNDQSSIGRRIFDVYIQGNLMLKDFNIMANASGVGKGITINFTDVIVNSSTLEISLYWAGKGTTTVPDTHNGVYGPLISAITITPNFNTHIGLSIGAIVGIVVVSAVILTSLLLFLWMKGYLGRKSNGDEAYPVLNTSYFTLRQIKAATNDFSLINKIGEGGFGPVYKGVLPNGNVIAVKRLSSKSKQGNREFINEIGMISALQHPNLVKLHGCCIEGKELMLVYEYMENNCLARALFGWEFTRLKLDWPIRKRICLGIARGLAYLHEDSRLKIVHRDIKATNVLLDKDLNAKISDFGLAKLDEDENTHISTRIVGTIGYMAPEYAMRGYLTDKVDVYSFGVVVLELVSGKSNTDYRPKGEFVYLLDWAYVLQEQGNLLELVDSSLGSNFPEDEALMLLNLALLCANPSPTLRPIMSSVVSMIEGKIQVQASIIKGIKMQEDDIRFRAFKRLPQTTKSIGSTTSEYSQVQKSVSMDCSLMDLSTSIQSKNEEAQKVSTSSKLLPEIELVDVNLD